MRFLLLLLFVGGLTGSSTLSSQDCEHPDFAALMAFYEATNGPEWDDNTGWADGANGTNCEPCSGWKGVLCSDGEIKFLILGSNNLSGFIPAAIGELEQLQVLSLNNNQLAGTIPVGIGNLSALTSLGLNDNNLSGPFPPDFFELSNLASLGMGRNPFNHPLPAEIGQLTSLRSVYMYNSGITGELPTEISQLENLERLMLRSNQIEGEIPPEIGNLANLITLYLDFNEISGILPYSMVNLTNLEQLYVGRNITGEIPIWLAQLSHLRGIGLSFNELTGTIPPELAELTNLVDINLGQNQLEGEIPQSLTSLQNLRSIQLGGNNLSGPIPEGFGLLDNFSTFSASSNNLSGCIPDDLAAICGQGFNFFIYLNPLMPWEGDHENFCNEEDQIGAPCNDGIPNNGPDVINEDCSCGDYVPPVVCDHPDYEALEAFYNATDGDNWTNNTGWLTDCEPCNWEGIFCADGQRVTHIYLNNRDLSGDILPAVLGLTELQELSLEGNQITGPVNDEIYDLPNLRLLALSNNPGIDVGSLLTGASTSLEELILRGCGFNQALPDIVSLPNLTRLTLDHNGIIGTINPTIYALENLEILGLNNNEISGEISSDIEQLTNLVSLGLGSNQLQGGLPTEIGSFANLEVLLAFNNPLGGTMPTSMNNLLQLRHLNLAQAEIGGEIPSGLGQLPNLEMVELWKNQLTGEIPLGFGDIASLTTLKLDNNQLSGCIPFDLEQKCGLPDGSVKLDDNPLLPWQGDFSQFCATPGDQAGASCNAGGVGDVIDSNCTCGPPFTCEHPDYAALAEFYHDLSGENWNNNDGWLTDCAPCNWFGITCNNNNRVTRISLPNNNLVGLIPSATANLTFLRNLNIPNSDIDGNLPYFFADHPNLRQINFNYCYFSGGIPPEFGEIPNLRFLRLRGNRLDGTIAEELGELDFIRLIDARDNQLQGPLDENLEGMLNTLQYLNLSNNNLRGCYPEELYDLCLVDFVDLSNNPLLPWQGDINPFCDDPDGQIGASCDAGSDNDIILDNCSCGPDPTCAHPDYTALENLYNATNGNVWFPASDWLLNCEPCSWEGIFCDKNERVISISLSNRNLTGALLLNEDDLPFLKRLQLSNNNIGGSLPEALFAHPALKQIDLSENYFEGELPPNTGEAMALLQLKINNNLLKGSLPSALGTGSLVFFDATVNDLSGCIPESLLNKCNEDFDLSQNPLLPWQGNFQNFCDGLDQQGADCNDGMVQTFGDLITDCVCSGIIFQDPACDEEIGSPCDDGNPKTKGEVILDDCSCGLTGKIFTSSQVFEGALRVFPNPSRGNKLTVILPAKSATLRLLTAEGREVYHAVDQSGTVSVPVSEFKPGLYLLAVESEARSWVRKVVLR